MFKDIFKQLIQNSGLSSYQISKDTGISESLISHWKNGRQLPKYDSLNILADYFNVSGDYLLGREDNNISIKNEEKITEQEHKVLSAYRQNTNMQQAVNKLLGVDGTNSNIND